MTRVRLWSLVFNGEWEWPEQQLKYCVLNCVAGKAQDDVVAGYGGLHPDPRKAREGFLENLDIGAGCWWSPCLSVILKKENVGIKSRRQWGKYSSRGKLNTVEKYKQEGRAGLQTDTATGSQLECWVWAGHQHYHVIWGLEQIPTFLWVLSVFLWKTRQ